MTTIDLAKKVADMPPPSKDINDIEDWAKSLAVDLCSQPRLNYKKNAEYAKAMGLKTDFPL